MGVRTSAATPMMPPPHRELRADAGVRVAARGHGVEAAARGVGEQQHGVADVEVGLQRVQRLLQQRRQVGGGGQARAGLAQGRQAVGRAARGRELVARHVLDVQHLVDVGALQAEHAAHADLRGNAGELGLHALEQRPCGLGAAVEQREAEAGAGFRMDDERRYLGVGEDVLARLVEELEAERDVLAVDVVHLRHQRDVGRAVGRAGGDGGGDGALEAGAQVVQAVGAVHALTLAPARGPGVCSKISATVKVTALSSPCGTLWMVRASSRV